MELLAIDWTRLQRVARWYPRSAYHLFRNLSVVMGERLAQTAASVGTECRSELRPADQRGRCGRRAHRNPRALAVESALKGAVGDRL